MMATSPASPVAWAPAVTRFAAGAVIVVGTLVLVGWALGVPLLQSIVPGHEPTKPSTAIAFLLAGGALAGLTSGAPRAIVLGRILAGATGLIAGLTVIEYASGVTVITAPATRVAPNAAVAFLAAAAALLALSTTRARAVAAAQVLALGVVGLAAISLAGYLYGAPDLFGIEPATRMTGPAAVTFVLLACGVLTARPADGPIALVLAGDLPGRLARQLLLAALTVPPVLGWLRLQGQQAGWYGTEASIGLVVIGTMALLCIVIYSATGSLKTTDRERWRSEEELRRTSARFETLFELAPDAIVVVDAGGIIDSANSHAETLFGYGRGELVGQPIETLVPVDLRARHVNHRRGFMAQPHTLPMGATRELRARRSDGTEFPTEISLSPLEFEDGLHVTAIVRDITERTEARDELRRLNLSLEQRVTERTAELKAANKELEAFSYSVAHDLRAPLRSLDGFTKILLDRYDADLPAEARRYLGIIRDSAGDMGRLIEALLAFSRLGRQALAIAPADPARLAREALADLAPVMAGRQVEVSIGDLPSCWADARLLRQVFANLLDNALKFTRDHETARIEVGARTEGEGGGEPTYYVRDDGAGFDMRYTDKLFGVFQRLHRADEFEGTGVGLATVARIVHRHGGRVWAEGEIGRGATFYFTMGGTRQ